MLRATPVWAAALITVLNVSGAFAKERGVHSPGGRRIYDSDETFEHARDTRRRDFVVEVAVGAGPEGNLAMLLGWINQPVRGLEYYAGIGFEINPARHYTGAVRYMFNISGYRPYLAAGYLFKDLYGIGSFSHNAFAEIGYSWVLHRTYHLTVGLGVRRILHVGIRPDSPLLDDDVDPLFLEQQIEGVSPWVPTLAIRFSRAF